MIWLITWRYIDIDMMLRGWYVLVCPKDAKKDRRSPARWLVGSNLWKGGTKGDQMVIVDEDKHPVWQIRTQPSSWLNHCNFEEICNGNNGNKIQELLRKHVHTNSLSLYVCKFSRKMYFGSKKGYVLVTCLDSRFGAFLLVCIVFVQFVFAFVFVSTFQEKGFGGKKDYIWVTCLDERLNIFSCLCAFVFVCNCLLHFQESDTAVAKNLTTQSHVWPCATLINT